MMLDDLKTLSSGIEDAEDRKKLYFLIQRLQKVCEIVFNDSIPAFTLSLS